MWLVMLANKIKHIRDLFIDRKLLFRGIVILPIFLTLIIFQTNICFAGYGNDGSVNDFQKVEMLPGAADSELLRWASWDKFLQYYNLKEIFDSGSGTFDASKIQSFRLQKDQPLHLIAPDGKTYQTSPDIDVETEVDGIVKLGADFSHFAVPFEVSPEAVASSNPGLILDVRNPAEPPKVKYPLENKTANSESRPEAVEQPPMVGVAHRPKPKKTTIVDIDRATYDALKKRQTEDELIRSWGSDTEIHIKEPDGSVTVFSLGDIRLTLNNSKIWETLKQANYPVKDLVKDEDVLPIRFITSDGSKLVVHPFELNQHGGMIQVIMDPAQSLDSLNKFLQVASPDFAKGNINIHGGVIEDSTNGNIFKGLKGNFDPKEVRQTFAKMFNFAKQQHTGRLSETNLVYVHDYGMLLLSGQRAVVWKNRLSWWRVWQPKYGYGDYGEEIKKYGLEKSLDDPAYIVDAIRKILRVGGGADDIFQRAVEAVVLEQIIKPIILSTQFDDQSGGQFKGLVQKKLREIEKFDEVDLPILTDTLYNEWRRSAKIIPPEISPRIFFTNAYPTPVVDFLSERLYVRKALKIVMKEIPQLNEYNSVIQVYPPSERVMDSHAYGVLLLPMRRPMTVIDERLINQVEVALNASAHRSITNEKQAYQFVKERLDQMRLTQNYKLFIAGVEKSLAVKRELNLYKNLASAIGLPSNWEDQIERSIPATVKTQDVPAAVEEQVLKAIEIKKLGYDPSEATPKLDEFIENLLLNLQKHSDLILTQDKQNYITTYIRDVWQRSGSDVSLRKFLIDTDYKQQQIGRLYRKFLINQELRTKFPNTVTTWPGSSLFASPQHFLSGLSSDEQVIISNGLYGLIRAHIESSLPSDFLPDELTEHVKNQIQNFKDEKYEQILADRIKALITDEVAKYDTVAEALDFQDALCGPVPNEVFEKLEPKGVDVSRADIADAVAKVLFLQHIEPVAVKEAGKEDGKLRAYLADNLIPNDTEASRYGANDYINNWGRKEILYDAQRSQDTVLGAKLGEYPLGALLPSEMRDEATQGIIEAKIPAWWVKAEIAAQAPAVIGEISQTFSDQEVLMQLVGSRIDAAFEKEQPKITTRAEAQQFVQQKLPDVRQEIITMHITGQRSTQREFSNADIVETATTEAKLTLRDHFNDFISRSRAWLTGNTTGLRGRIAEYSERGDGYGLVTARFRLRLGDVLSRRQSTWGDANNYYVNVMKYAYDNRLSDLQLGAQNRIYQLGIRVITKGTENHPLAMRMNPSIQTVVDNPPTFKNDADNRLLLQEAILKGLIPKERHEEMIKDMR